MVRTDVPSEPLTGEALFAGATAQAILVKRFMSPAPKVSAARDVSPEIDELLARLVTRSSVDRIASGLQVIEALDRIGRAPRETPARTEASREQRPQKSNAVVPLTNLSADPENEYFSDGMTEEIINALAKAPSLQVASRSSSFAFKGKQVDVREVGKRPGVTTVLERAVQARSGGMIYLHLDPGYGPLREEPRFGALVQRSDSRE